MQFVRLEWQVTATRPFLNHTALHAAYRVTNLCVCKRSCAVTSLRFELESGVSIHLSALCRPSRSDDWACDVTSVLLRE